MAQSIRVISSAEVKAFNDFFYTWLENQKQYKNQLATKAEAYKRDQTQHQNSILSELVDNVVGHYEELYEAKKMITQTEAVSALWPFWGTSLEDMFMWLGSWHPTMAFELLHSKMGMQIRSKLGESSSQGTSNGDLADLPAYRLQQIEELRKKITTEGHKITADMSTFQAKVADPATVALSHNGAVLKLSDKEDNPQVVSVIKEKEEGLKQLLLRAESLRLTTLKSVVQILTPIQAVHFLIAAIELFHTVHDWGSRETRVLLLLLLQNEKMLLIIRRRRHLSDKFN